MKIFCGYCRKELEPEIISMSPGSNDPAILVEPCGCMEKESLREAAEEVIEAWNDVVNRLGFDNEEYRNFNKLLEDLNEKVR